LEQVVFEVETRQARLDLFLADHFPALSLTRIRRAIAEGGALLNGSRVTAGWRLLPGDRVSWDLIADEPTATTPEPIPVEILREDDDLIVVNKQAGLLTHPSRAEKSGALTNALAYHFQQTGQAGVRPGLIHRLDRDTSGLMVVAKNARSHRILAKAFRQRRVEKRYLALVHGEVELEVGQVEAPIGRDPETWPRWQVLEGGRPAQTRYQVRERLRGHTLLELEPLTGRTHQIRIHCAWIGHPLAGDGLYRSGSPSSAEPLGADDLALPHHLLHAYYLCFPHPNGAEQVELSVPPPWLLAASVAALRPGPAN